MDAAYVGLALGATDFTLCVVLGGISSSSSAERSINGSSSGRSCGLAALVAGAADTEGFEVNLIIPGALPLPRPAD